jgi:hypothetical protein
MLATAGKTTGHLYGFKLEDPRGACCMLNEINKDDRIVMVYGI